MSLSIIAAIIEKGREHGLAESAILDLVQAAVSASDGTPERTARQERNARYYEKKKAERLNECLNKTSYSDVLQDEVKKEIPPTPPKEKNYTHSTGEPTPVVAYTKSIADVYAIAGQACPSLYPAHRWLKAGWPVELVCEVIRAKLAANPGNNFNLAYFENAIADAVARANAPVPIGSPPNQRAGPRPNGSSKPTSIFAQLSKGYREGQKNELHHTESPNVLIDAKPLAGGFG